MITFLVRCVVLTLAATIAGLGLGPAVAQASTTSRPVLVFESGGFTSVLASGASVSTLTAPLSTALPSGSFLVRQMVTRGDTASQVMEFWQDRDFKYLLVKRESFGVTSYEGPLVIGPAAALDPTIPANCRLVQDPVQQQAYRECKRDADEAGKTADRICGAARNPFVPPSAKPAAAAACASAQAAYYSYLAYCESIERESLICDIPPDFNIGPVLGVRARYDKDSGEGEVSAECPDTGSGQLCEYSRAAATSDAPR